ncbi:MAG: Hpt domain-containing protein [Gammaproteobacteria bacterium]|nr:Hpt domain-containing protein [Gammaproteobacteria bacterium]
MNNVSNNIYLDNETTSMLIDALEEDFIDIIKEYMQNAEQHIVSLKGMDVERSRDMIDVVHALKGSSGNVGAIYLSAICDKMESDLRLNKLSGIDEYVKDIDSTFRGTCELLEKLIQEIS